MTPQGIDSVGYVLIGWAITQASILVGYWLYFKIDDAKNHRLWLREHYSREWLKKIPANQKVSGGPFWAMYDLFRFNDHGVVVSLIKAFMSSKLWINISG